MLKEAAKEKLRLNKGPTNFVDNSKQTVQKMHQHVHDKFWT